jgi:hypothetical protein
MRSLIFCLFAGVVLLGTTVPAEAGASKGSIKRVATVQGFYSITYKVAFKPGKPAVVLVQGDGDTALSLVILDPQGKRVTSDSKNGDKPSVRWTPTTDEPYQIKIYNRGGVPNRFLLRTN